MSAGTYEQASVSQQEALKPEPSEAAQENQYSFPSSSHGFPYENAQQPEVTFPQSQTSSQMQNLAPFSNVMVMHRVVRFWICKQNIFHGWILFWIFNELE